MQGGVQDGTGGDLTATGTEYQAASSGSDDTPDNMIEGAIAASSWSYQDLLLVLTAVNAVLFLALFLLEVREQW